MLDEVDNAEGCPLTPLPDFMVHFGLSDEGKIEFDCFGEATEDVLFRLVYPVLDEAMLNAASDGPVNLMPEGLAVFNEAIVQERKRV